MKKILLFIAALSVALSLTGQTRESLTKALDKAKTNSQNEKKATNPSTWISLADAYMKAYEFPKKDIWIGISQTEAKLMLKNQQVLSSEVKDFSGLKYTVDVYPEKTFYYNAQGVLEIVRDTKPIVAEDMLEAAYYALIKAFELDKKGSKKEDIGKKLLALRESYVNEGLAAYSLGEISKANYYFENSLKAYDNPVLQKVDSIYTYYTAVTFQMLEDKDNAIKYYEQCKEIGYHSKGDVYSSLGDLYKAKGEIDKAKAYLNEGFQKYPDSQSILVSLINIYLETKDDPQKVLDLLKTAQINEPNNPSLYYAEGNVYKELNRIEEAVQSYYKSYEINNTYVYGIYSIGLTYFDLAIKTQTDMDALDVSDIEGYDKLTVVFEDYLMKAIDPFEKAFAATEDKDFRLAIADGLKQIYFRFRDKSEDYMNGYTKYNEYLKENQTAPEE